MTAPGVALPAAGSTSWYTHYTQLDTITRSVTPANNNRVAFMGDSITALNGTGDNVTTFEGSHDNYSSILPTLSGGRMQWGRSFATGGLTISEIRDIVLPRLLAIPTAQLPGTCVILGGTNDGLTSLSASISALTDIATTLRNNLIRPVLCTIPPRSDSTGANTAANQLNARIVGLARKLGIPLLDFHAALVDGTTGGFISGMHVGDGVHPMPSGMMAMAQAAIDGGILNWLPPWDPYLVRATADTTDLFAGAGLFLTDTAGIANGWTGASTTGTATYAAVTPTVGDDCLGRWQRVTRAAAGGTGYTFLQISIPISGVASVGDLLSLDARIRWSGISDSGIAVGGNGPQIGLYFRDAGASNLDAIDFACSRDITGVVHLDRRVPTSTTTVLASIALPGPTSGTAVYDIGQLTLRNWTSIGLA